MKRLILLTLMSASSALAMTTANQKGKVEADFIAAITSGNIPAITAQLDKGMSPNLPFNLMGYRGYTPLSIALMKQVPAIEYRNNTVQMKGIRPNAANQYEVIKLLVTRGADQKALQDLLQFEIGQGNSQQALNIVNTGIADKDGRLLAAIKAQEAKESSVAKKIEWAAIRAKLEKTPGAQPATTLPVVVAQTEVQKELDLYRALLNADITAVKRAINAGASVKAFSSSPDKRGFFPLQYAYGKDARHKEVMELLLAQGADPVVLNRSILAEALEGDAAMVLWLLKHGAKDTDNVALDEITKLAGETSNAQKKANYLEIKTIIENFKK
ncbi:hypothetical protein BH09DEP1_BH09DEP1_4150 [soil metagenome]